MRVKAGDKKFQKGVTELTCFKNPPQFIKDSLPVIFLLLEINLTKGDPWKYFLLKKDLIIEKMFSAEPARPNQKYLAKADEKIQTFPGFGVDKAKTISYVYAVMV